MVENKSIKNLNKKIITNKILESVVDNPLLKLSLNFKYWFNATFESYAYYNI